MRIETQYVDAQGREVVTVYSSLNGTVARCEIEGKIHRFKGETALIDAQRCANSAVINLVHVQDRVLMEVEK
jgi:hypothetical protein